MRIKIQKLMKRLLITIKSCCSRSVVSSTIFMNITTHLLAIILTVGLTSCSTTQFVSDSFGDVDASQFSTYTLEDHCSDDINPIMQIRIKNAVQQSLHGRGIILSDRANLLVKYFVKNTNQRYTLECSEYYSRWDGGIVCRERVVSYEEGSIVIDMVDTRSNTIIWHGAAYGASWSRSRDANKAVNTTVGSLLDRFF